LYRKPLAKSPYLLIKWVKVASGLKMVKMLKLALKYLGFIFSNGSGINILDYLSDYLR